MPYVMLKNWAVVSSGDNYAAPETVTKYLTGNVFGHPNFEDGTQVDTSRLVELDVENGVAKTISRIYRLGNMKDEYATYLNRRKNGS
jgi:hypothetical protein